MWLADMVDGKWVEDYVVVRRDTYDIVTEADGAVFALIENGQNSECHPSSLEDDRVVTDKGKANGRMLVKAPNVKHYRIPEDVYRIAANAFQGCTELTDIDIPYCIDDFEIEKASSCI